MNLTKIVVRLLKRLSTGKRNERQRRRRDLDDVVGTASRKEADELRSALAEQRRVDKDLWR